MYTMFIIFSYYSYFAELLQVLTPEDSRFNDILSNIPAVVAKDGVTVVNDRRISRTERTTAIIIIKKITITTITVDDMIIEDNVASYSVAENRVKTEITVAAIEISTISIDTGIYYILSEFLKYTNVLLRA